MVISEQLRHITDNPKFALFELVCVFVACGLWYIQPQLGWWPLLIALSPAVLRLLVGKQFIKPTPLDIAIAVFMVTAGIGVWAAFDREIAWAKFWFLDDLINDIATVTHMPASDHHLLDLQQFDRGILHIIGRFVR